MSLPLPPNLTCDIYRSGNSPPASPDVAGVSCRLDPDFVASHVANVASTTINRWTHILLVDVTVDIRDGYRGNDGSGQEQTPSGWDSVYVPDHTGTRFTVVLVVRVGRGTTQDHKRVYLNRAAPSWPSSDI